MKKRFGDRKDAKRIKTNGVFNLIYYIKPSRSVSEVYITKKYDVTELVKYMKDLKKESDDYTYFHVFCTAIAKLVYNKNHLNRFLMKSKFFQRDDVTISFVAKVDFNDSSEELMSVIKIDKTDNVDSVKDKFISKVKNMRTNTKNDTDDTINKVGKMPHIIRSIIMGIFKFLDNHDLLPTSITKDDIYHASVLVSNLGSIGGGAIYHNLTDFGTNSLLVTIGDIHKEQVVNKDGKVEIRDIVEFGITADERIADGFYLVKSASLLQEYFNNPKVLKENVNEKYPR